jgi:hypothetical protein
MGDLSKYTETVTVQFKLSDEEWLELNDRWGYHEWHWSMYSYMNSSIINGVSVVELKMNDFIADYFTFCDKDRSKQFIEYFLSKMNLQQKFVLFKKLLPHIDINELGEINDTDYSKLDKFEQIITYRNMFAHSVLDQNYKNPKELKQRQRIKLQYLSAKSQKQNSRFVTIKEHRKIMELLSDINLMLMDIVIDTNRDKFPDIFLNHNSVDVEKYEPRFHTKVGGKNPERGK